MEKRLLIAAGLSLLILVTWNVLFPPPPRPRPPLPAAASEAVGVAPDAGPEALEPPPPEEPAAVASDPVAAEAGETVRVETAHFDVTLTNEGAAVASWKLRDYRTFDGQPLDLFPSYVGDAPRPLGVVLDDVELTEALAGALWQVAREPLEAGADGGAGERVTFRWADGRGLAARKSFEFRESAYLVGVELEVSDRGRRLEAALSLGPGFGAQEAASSYYYEAWVRASDGHVAHRQKNAKKGYEQGGSLAGGIEWAGLEDQYFSMLLLPNAAPSRLTATPVPLVRQPLGTEETATRAEMIVALTVPAEGAELFVGPKSVDLLTSLPRGLERCIWYFDNALLEWISRKIHLSLLWLHDRVVPNYGLAIVLATVILRLLLFPVNQFAMVNMKKTQLQMQKLQPKIKRIREKYRKQKDSQSRAAMNQEMMELYKREGVNPMGGVTGCVPLVAQFPILIGFYGMLTVAVELRGADFFGWVHDLSRADPLYILPLLMGVTMFGQQVMAMTKVKDPMQQQQQRIMLIMPVVFTIICVNLPSGLVLYWFVNNLLGMGQQWLVNRHTERIEAAHAAREGGKRQADETEADDEDDPGEQVAPKREPRERKTKAKLTR
jgi:YidC/Oxa1 family membrane protein insertase